MLAALARLFLERSGVIKIALEDLMLFGAFAGAVMASATHSPWVGIPYVVTLIVLMVF